MARRPRRFQRRNPFSAPRLHILIVCEGKVTEIGYFEGCREAFKNGRVKVYVDHRDGAAQALLRRASLLRKEADLKARRIGDDSVRYDEVWCVFDVDDKRALDLSSLRQEAEQYGIHLAISNPCFEIWALLHFQDHTAYIERRSLAGLLRRLLPDYEKALPFNRLYPSYPTAVQRATALDRQQEAAGDPGGNPSTGVYRLTERIREGGRVRNR